MLLGVMMMFLMIMMSAMDNSLKLPIDFHTIAICSGWIIGHVWFARPVEMKVICCWFVFSVIRLEADRTLEHIRKLLQILGPGSKLKHIIKDQIFKVEQEWGKNLLWARVYLQFNQCPKWMVNSRDLLKIWWNWC